MKGEAVWRLAANTRNFSQEIQEIVNTNFNEVFDFKIFKVNF
jgi:hypothetical protein